MGGALGAGLSIFGQVNNYNDQMKMADAQRKQAVTQMNFAFQNYELERQDSFDQAVNEITQIRMRSASTQATVQTAVNERMSGRTAKMITRVAEAKGETAFQEVKNNYSRKSNEIDLNKESALRSTQSYLNQIKNPSSLGLALGIASTVAGAKNQMENARADAQSKGLDFDDYNYLWTSKGGISTPKKRTPPVDIIPTLMKGDVR